MACFTFSATLSVLTSENNTFFTAMFSDQFQTKPDEKGQYFIDRDPVLFHYIIKYLRNVSIDPDWCKLNKENLLEEFKDEIEFYQIHSLRDKIELRLKPLEILEYSHLFDIEFRGRRTALVSRPVDGKGTGGILIAKCMRWTIRLLTYCAAMRIGVVHDRENFDRSPRVSCSGKYVCNGGDEYRYEEDTECWYRDFTGDQWEKGDVIEF
jgi:hypothetical protein